MPEASSWPRIRKVSNSRSDGPSPRRARRAAFRTAWCTARMSLPSTTTPGMPYPRPRSARWRARVLLVRRRRKAVLVVLDQEEDRELPDRGQVEGLVEVALAGGPVAGEGRRHPAVAPKLRGQGHPAGHRQHGPEVADHPHDALLEVTEVEGPVAPLGEAALPAQELAEEAGKVEIPSGEDPEVAVHREDEVAGPQGGDDPGGDGLLADPGEPLGQAPLPQEQEHLLLDHPREEDRAIQVPQSLGGGSVDRVLRLRRRGTGVIHSRHSTGMGSGSAFLHTRLGARTLRSPSASPTDRSLLLNTRGTNGCFGAVGARTA